MTAWFAHRGITVAPRAGVVRLAMHAYTTLDDIDALCDGNRVLPNEVPQLGSGPEHHDEPA